jgi:hypothetical protein
MKSKYFYVVALISFFENEIKQFTIYAENEYDAVKKAMVEFTNDKYKSEEIEFQLSEGYPKDILELTHYLSNSDMSFSVMEVGSFLN